jgi:hypothetical protein
MTDESASRRKDSWTKEQEQAMLELRDQRLPWKVIASDLGRTVESCCARYRAIVPSGSRKRFVSIRNWTAEEEATIKVLMDEGRKPRQIALHMGKPLQTIYSKMQHMRQPGRAFHIDLLPRVTVPQHCLEDRDRRLTAERDLTAEFFGDPAPGQSALDKRQGAVA